jgi:hypothetical protein
VAHPRVQVFSSVDYKPRGTIGHPRWPVYSEVVPWKSCSLALVSGPANQKLLLVSRELDEAAQLFTLDGMFVGRVMRPTSVHSI